MMNTLEKLKKEREEKLEKLRENPIEAMLVGEVPLITDYKRGRELYLIAFFGNPMGVRKPKLDIEYRVPYILSYYEALYLLEKGVLTFKNIDRNKAIEKLWEIARSKIEDFEYKYIVYKDLRERGYVVRPGMKFGSDFAVYIYGPGIDHAPFLVTVFSKNQRLTGIDLIRAGRLANSVRKQWVIASVEGDGLIRYYVFSWFKL